MIASYAWRNLWRNKLRSSILITAVTLGIFACTFLIAFVNGMVNDRIHTIISTELTHIQIHQPEFLDNNQFSLLIENADSIVKKVHQAPHVHAASKRVIISSMIATAETGTGVKITGIDPQDESKVTNLSTRIIAGRYLDETSKNPILISERLASKLKVGLRNKIIITTQDINQNIAMGAFRVTGIYRTDNMIFDEANVFVSNKDICRLTGINDHEAHEIAILLNENKYTDTAAKSISGYFPNLEVKDWHTLSPEAGYLISAMNQYMYIFLIIILLALCFGIINTMLMAIMERVKELGMLMAIGMNKIRVFTMIMLETVFLSISGGILGIIIGYASSRYLGKTGIDLYFWKEAYAEFGYSSLVYPIIDMEAIIITTIMIIIAGILSAIYPAYKALRLNPSEAIKTS